MTLKKALKLNKTMTLKIIAIPVLMLALFATSATSQTFKPNFGTKIVLAGGGTDPVNTMTITTASGGTSPITLTMPNSYAGGAGYVLTSNSSGVLTWTNPTTGITLGGDVTGPAGANTVTKINGVSLGSTTATAGNLLIGSGTQWVSNALSGDATLSGTGVITLANTSGARTDLGLGSIATQSASAVALTGGTITGTSISGSTGSFTTLTSLGADNQNTSGSAATNIGTGTYTGTVTIGNSTGPSTTNLNGTIVFGSAPTIPLAQNNIFVGNSSGNQAAYAPVANSVLVTSGTGGLVPTWSTSLPSGLTLPTATLTSATVTGATISGGSINNTPIGATTASTGAFTNLTATGTVTLPAGSVSLSSLTLPTGDIVVGNGSNQAAGVALSGDATISSAGVITVGAGAITNTKLANSTIAIASSGGTMSVSGSPIALGGTAGNVDLNLAHANTWTGTQTLGGVALTANSPAALASNTVDWALSTSNSYFKISASASVNVSGIASGVDGRTIVLVNTGSSPITLVSEDATDNTAANRFHFPGGAGNNVLIATDGVVTLMYDGTASRWRILASE